MTQARFEYDLAVIGSGPGGYVAAIRAAQLGFKTVLIEKDPYLGGTCLNVGCIPSKTMLHSTEQFYFLSHQGEKHGILSEGLRFDVNRLQDRRTSVIEGMRNGVRQFVAARKIDILHGHAKLTDRHQIQLAKEGSSQTVTARHILIATGSQPAGLEALPFDGEHIVSSTEALTWKEVPQSIVVVGAGAIGLELGSVWNRLGAKVTVVEFLPRIASGFDDALAKAAERTFARQGINFMTSTEVLSGEVKNGKVVLTARKDDVEVMIDADRVLVAVGRKPYTEGLGLEAVGVEVDAKGRIVTDEQFRTRTPGIYAIGDVIAGPMLAHKAEEEGVAAVEFIANGWGHVDYQLIPNVIYTAPELASVGLTEEKAREQFKQVKVGKFNVGANGRAIASDHNHGLVKVVTDAETDRILGVHILAHQASELIASAVAHVQYGASSEDLARTMHAHPTLSESIKEAALAVEERAIHALPPRS